MASRKSQGASRRQERSDAGAIEINGWAVFAHPLFLDQVESLLAAVEGEVAKGKEETANMKVLRGIYYHAFEAIPKAPNDPRFRQGSTLGTDLRHWFRAKFGNGRFRLFYRYQSEVRVIVLGWVNDESTLRTRGDKRDAYAVFRRMLASGNPPDLWEELYEAARSAESVRRVKELRPKE